MINYEVVIGIEVHAELNTKTKIFSSAPVSFAAPPNTQVNELDLGYPGAKPTLNKEAVRLAILVCDALNMEIDHLLTFDRKNYFYSDLAKGFQITQQYHPIGRNGHLNINVNKKNSQIMIERLHLEEDTAKQIHQSDQTLLDYNRSGIGLIEIVTKPVINSAEQACAYITELQQILIYTGASDAKMSEGSMRCDINISLRPFGSKKFNSKVEIKNLNSLANITKSIEYEIKRQSEILYCGKKVSSETRRFDEKTKTTILMRAKTTISDYKYFTEPNILPITLDSNWVQEVLENKPELPTVRKNRIKKQYNLNEEDIIFLMNDINLTKYFEETLKHYQNPQKVINYLSSEIQGYLNQNHLNINQIKLTPIKLGAILKLLDQEVISSKQVKVLIHHLLINDDEIDQTIKKLGLKQITNKKEIYDLIIGFIEENLNLIDEFENRSERVLKFYMGHLMKITKGQVNPQIAQDTILEIINLKLKQKCE